VSVFATLLHVRILRELIKPMGWVDEIETSIYMIQHGVWSY